MLLLLSQQLLSFREGADLIAEIDVDADSVTGTFVTGESVTTTDTTLDLEISAVVKGIVTGGTVTTGGAYYSTGDSVHVTGGAGNNAATARVGSAGAGNIDEILIESGGSGYSIGERTSVYINKHRRNGCSSKDYRSWWWYIART